MTNADPSISAISAMLRDTLPETVHGFVQARSCAGGEPFWLLEYAQGHLTLMVTSSVGARGATLPEVRFGERTQACDFWLSSPAVFESRCVLLMYGSDVRATRADIVACVEMLLHQTFSH